MRERGKYIKELRENNNYTQEELAKKLYVSRQTISNIENNKCNISYELSKNMAKIFNIDVMDIFLGGEEEYIPKEEVNNFITSFGKKLNNRFKIITCSLGIIILTLVVLLSIVYLNLNYNTIKFYNLYGASNTYKVNDGLMILSKEKIILKLEVDNLFENNNQHKIQKIKLISNYNNNSNEIYSTDDNKLYIVDKYGYNEYFNYNHIINSTEKLSLIILYDDNKTEEINLDFYKIYENRKILFLKNKKVLH